MKNQYFGDVNDYQKYGLLRIFSDIGRFQIGVCWMLTEDNESSDGKKKEYLEIQKWRKYDPDLFDRLKEILRTHRNPGVESLQKGLLIPNAAFYEKILTDECDDRYSYFFRMNDKLKDSDLFFFDPDNGIEVKSVKIGRKNSSKYVYWDELRHVFQKGKSILVYQHLIRENVDIFIKRIKLAFQINIGAFEVYSFRTNFVVYFLATQPQHSKKIWDCAMIVREKWREKIIVE